MAGEIVSIGSLEAKPPDWLWQGYLVRGGINVIVGAKGVGKTSFACWLAARASVGDQNFGGQPLRVLIDSQEDDPEIVLRPRIEAAGADMALIDTRKPGSPAWKFPRNVERLSEYLVEQERSNRPVDLIVFDSLSAYVPRFTTAEKADEALELLTAVCRRYRCALVFVHHFNKSGRTIDAAIGGAGAVTRVARTVFVFGDAPHRQPSLIDRLAALDHEEVAGERMLALACHKLNLAAKPSALQYTSTTTDIATVESVHRLDLTGEIECSAQAVFEQLRLPPRDGAVQTEVETAINWLLDYVKDGPRPSRSATADAKLDGISERTLERARAEGRFPSIPPGRLAKWLSAEAYQALTDQERKAWWIALPAVPDVPPEEWSN